jgi:hydroxymethylbilane synthase
VHSLKDLPTELPDGLRLGAVGKRADVRDVLLYRAKGQGTRSAANGRGYIPKTTVRDLPEGAVVATSSTRRKAQLLEHNPGLKAPDIRGNVLTRIQKLADKPELDATVLALAGLTRLSYTIDSEGRLCGEGIPEGILATVLDIETMLPCVGQGAVGIEIREDDAPSGSVCDRLNHSDTYQCVLAERAFLSGMGGGCQSPVAAYAEVLDGQIRMRTLSFANGPVRQATASAPLTQAVELGHQLAAELKA